ncbi:hypothetical protein [Paenibacillus macerans]|uniref:hypothetical protein n=1 Tax=Paenibacillus macerans TaxID=44252 RepID=UPI00203AA513|nr:hypothetical protein [Paenibacillus macerans]
MGEKVKISVKLIKIPSLWWRYLFCGKNRRKHVETKKPPAIGCGPLTGGFSFSLNENLAVVAHWSFVGIVVMLPTSWLFLFYPHADALV